MSEDTFASRSAWRRYVIDRNPFYLLSAICMLFGCVALTNSSSWTSIKLNRLLILIATLNFYEAILIGLAMFLLVKRRLRRDANILLIIEAFFLVDVTFLNSEIFTANIKVGLIVNAILFLLAIAKLAAVFWALGLPIGGGAFFALVFSMATLFAMPGVFKQLALHRNGALPNLAIYSAWWMVGFLIPFAVKLLRNRGQFDVQVDRAFWQARGILILFGVLPIAALIAHISTSNWIYAVPWHWANLSPMLLGIGLARGISDTSVFTRARRANAQFWMGVLAIVASLENPATLFFTISHAHFSSLRLALLAAAIVYIHGLIVHRNVMFAFAACACLTMTGLGTSIEQMLDHVSKSWQHMVGFLRRRMPSTQTDWGVVSLAAAFALLVVGAMVSLGKPVEPKATEERTT